MAIFLVCVPTPFYVSTASLATTDLLLHISRKTSDTIYESEFGTMTSHTRSSWQFVWIFAVFSDWAEAVFGKFSNTNM